MTFHSRFTPAQIAAHEAHKARQARMRPQPAQLPPPAPKAASERPIPLPTKTAQGHPTIGAIIAVVSEAYGVSEAGILSERRAHDVVRPRQVAMYLAKDMTLHGYSPIGRSFGGRDHTTAQHAVTKITSLIVWDASLREIVSALRARINGADVVIDIPRPVKRLPTKGNHWWPEVYALRKHGLKYREIAERLGKSENWIGNICNPTYRQADNERRRIKRGKQREKEASALKWMEANADVIREAQAILKARAAQ